MAIGGWFLPPFLYVIPTLVLREAWKAADPAVPPGDDSWKRNKDNPLLWVWFAVYGVGTVVLSRHQLVAAVPSSSAVMPRTSPTPTPTASG